MIFDLLRNGFSLNTLISLCVRVFSIFCIIPIHEFAHAFVADKLGDKTAKMSGRLTIAPMAHIDYIGALMMLLVGFGYARPVPVNARNFKNPKFGMALTAAAGPMSNFLLAIFYLNISNLCAVFYYNSGNKIANIAMMFCMFASQINVSLAIFNLLPIPPLDGSRLVNVILPAKYYFRIMQYERYIVWGLLGLLMFGVLDVPLSFLTGKVMKLLALIASIPFGEYGEIWVRYF